MPGTHGVIVQQQDFRNVAAAHALVQQHQRVGAPPQPMCGRSSRASSLRS
jgi:hypothetical protein